MIEKQIDLLEASKIVMDKLKNIKGKKYKL